MHGLSLFTGIGGLDVALSKYCDPVAYCEIDPYCQSVLLSRMQEGDLPKAPIWDDIRTFPHQEIPRPDIIYGSFPCQDISVAGHGKGLEGERSGLFFEILRISKEVKPAFIFLENVPAITTRGGLRVVREITQMGYDCRWCVISAASVGALHRRERWFLLAHAKTKECHGLSSRKKTSFSPVRNYSEHETIKQWQEAVSTVCRITDGVPHRVERVKSLGNAVVPVQAKEAFEVLVGIK